LAQSGATLKKVMARIGHSTTRAAMVYQQATMKRDQAITAALNSAHRRGTELNRE
jgi:hypothetical protein